MILRLRLLLIVTCFFFLCLNLVFAQESSYSIKGRIITTLPIEQLQDIPVVLLMLNKEANPPMLPIQRSKTNKQGEYIFKNIIPKANTEYLIGALIAGDRISSKPIKLGLDKVQVLNITYPSEQDNLSAKISLDLSSITYVNRLLIFHLLENFIRITEIIQIQNNSDTFVSSKAQPLEVALPKDYQNFASFQVGDELLTSKISKGNVFLTFLLPPLTKSNLYFEYDIPFNQELNYTHPALLTNIPLSILFDQRYLDVVVLRWFLEFDKHGKYTIGAFPKTPHQELQIKIQAKILPQKLFYIFGAIFFVLALLSLIVFQIFYQKQKLHLSNLRK